MQPNLVHDEPGPSLHPSFAASGLSDSQQTARTQSLFTSFSPESQDEVAPSAAYKYL
ncbi:hypothetical protein AXF42_Ash021633 [Apostasia shenzhenica]|uniref:Uncharacterized protein n=1 Tax=Apostasia shenzhenica TaxID=1088818 RepID=A0A2H9ZZV2_9ASPA|nr:hypothetical protein AXF42_Ash021633 [Apostasia shenzhenica]